MSGADKQNGAAALTQRLGDFFAARGFRPVEPAMLLPADIVLDHMGEDIRRRLLITAAPDGTEYCLRPDFTLPVALWHIGQGGTKAARYSYAGFAFRFPSPADPLRRSAEFRQAGIEDFGGADAGKADAESVEAASAALAEGGLKDAAFTFGDVALFSALVDRLNLGTAAAARLRRLFWRRSETKDIVAAIAAPAVAPSEAALGRTLARLDPSDAQAVIGEVMAIAGVGGAGGREASEIAARFAAKAREAEGEGPGPEIARIVEQFLAISVTGDKATAALERFAKSAGLDLDQPIEALARRLDLISGIGVALKPARFSAAFGRRIEYYTGHVFEARARGREDVGPIASGGRYDRFLTDLGAKRPVAAVGCSIYVERLAAVGFLI